MCSSDITSSIFLIEPKYLFQVSRLFPRQLITIEKRIDKPHNKIVDDPKKGI